MCESAPGTAPDNPSTPGGAPGGFHRDIPGAGGGFVAPGDVPMSDRTSESMVAAGMDPTSRTGRAVATLGAAAGFPPQSSRSSPAKTAAMGHPVVGAALSFLGDFFNQLEKLGATVVRGEEAFGKRGRSDGTGFRGEPAQVFVDPLTGLVVATPESRMVAQSIMAEQSRDRAASRASSPRSQSGRLSTLLSDTRGERLG